jgi:hypothetical protein
MNNNTTTTGLDFATIYSTFSNLGFFIRPIQRLFDDETLYPSHSPTQTPFDHFMSNYETSLTPFATGEGLVPESELQRFKNLYMDVNTKVPKEDVIDELLTLPGILTVDIHSLVRTIDLGYPEESIDTPEKKHACIQSAVQLMNSKSMNNDAKEYDFRCIISVPVTLVY